MGALDAVVLQGTPASQRLQDRRDVRRRRLARGPGRHPGAADLRGVGAGAADHRADHRCRLSGRARAVVDLRADAGGHRQDRRCSGGCIDHAPYRTETQLRHHRRARTGRAVSDRAALFPAEVRGCGRGNHGQIDRRTAICKSLRRQVQRLLRRGHPGRNPDPTGQDRCAQGDLAHLDPALCEQPEQPARDRQASLVLPISSKAACRKSATPCTSTCS